MSATSAVSSSATWMTRDTSASDAANTSASETESTNATNSFAATLAAMFAPTPPPPPAVSPRALGDAVRGMLATETRTTSTSTSEAGSDATKTNATDAASATNRTSANAITRPNNDLAALDPVFRTRLQRVMDRMQREHGHDVTVVEGVRSRERQDYLYEQGRTRPGEVVTWTRNSNHLTGRAVDVKIDGTYNNPEGYRRLAQIASEEGLRTLGARDPGHIELPKGAGSGTMGEQLLPAMGGVGDPSSQGTHQEGGFGHHMSWSAGSHARAATSDDVADVADVATVAEVAKVADVAQVASVAQVATPGIVHSPTAATSRVAGSGRLAVDQVEKTMAINDAASSRPLSHVTLSIDNDAGGTDQVRVQLRGNTVDTTIAMSSPADASRASLHVGDLRQSLERHGLTAESVRITEAGASMGQTSGVRTVHATTQTFNAGANGNSSSQSDSRHGSESFGSDREPSTQREFYRNDADDPRHRARKAPYDRR